MGQLSTFGASRTESLSSQFSSPPESASPSVSLRKPDALWDARFVLLDGVASSDNSRLGKLYLSIRLQGDGLSIIWGPRSRT